ncbi:MAG: hypothetical protein Q9M91_02110 [Candidatus Dojkabacteria bacterium]|nr:hypothetical protein [Candidatus Dojkabacteria bacterium]MDQ7020618.1 hypothetical protein [Candidatus Dojkabacteria bacterium]
MITESEIQSVLSEIDTFEDTNVIDPAFYETELGYSLKCLESKFLFISDQSRTLESFFIDYDFVQALNDFYKEFLEAGFRLEDFHEMLDQTDIDHYNKLLDYLNDPNLHYPISLTNEDIDIFAYVINAVNEFFTIKTSEALKRDSQSEINYLKHKEVGKDYVLLWKTMMKLAKEADLKSLHYLSNNIITNIEKGDPSFSHNYLNNENIKAEIGKISREA